MNIISERNVCAFLLLLFAAAARAAILYVDINNTNPSSPYASWATAARVIQDAVDVARSGDEVVVNDGIYETGGRVVSGTLTNRVAVTKSLSLRSVNGPDVTIIRGYHEPGTTNGDAAVRCVFLTNGASLVGFALTGGATRSWTADRSFDQWSGGGVLCESVGSLSGGEVTLISNCVLRANAAYRGGGVASGTLVYCNLSDNSATESGGGAYSSKLRNCTLSANSALYGGGAAYSSLDNCILVGNSATEGGGAYGMLTLAGNAFAWHIGHENCTLVGNAATSKAGGVCGANCFSSILYYNTAPVAPNYAGVSAQFCCLSPLPSDGIGNITNAPRFVELPTGNLHLQSNSPCINAGWRAGASTDTDLDGNARIMGGTVDIGAYEYARPQSSISYAWLQQSGLPTDGSGDSADLDGDGLNNWQEWRAGTDPTDAASALRLLSPLLVSNGLVLRWQSVNGIIYVLERKSDLNGLSQFTALPDYIEGQAGITAYTDTNTAGPGPFFYRVRVAE